MFLPQPGALTRQAFNPLVMLPYTVDITAGENPGEIITSGAFSLLACSIACMYRDGSEDLFSSIITRAFSRLQYPLRWFLNFSEIYPVLPTNSTPLATS